MTPYADKAKNDECKRRWYHNHREELHEKYKKRYEQNRDYYRRTRLNTHNGNIYRLNKRQYPHDDKCEICLREYKMGTRNRTGLHYHHWDDNNYNKGIWVCPRCHRCIEYIEGGIKKGIYDTYMKWKKILDEEMNVDTIKTQIRNPKKIEIIELINKGRSNPEIANELDVNICYVSEIRTMVSDIPRWVKWSPQKVKFLLDNLGKISIIQIANQLGFKKLTIYTKIHELKKEGVIKGDLRFSNDIQILKPDLPLEEYHEAIL